MYWSRGIFQISMDGATQIPISEFEARWYNSRVCVLYFQGLQIPKLPTGQILDLGVYRCSCSHINFLQTAVEEKLIWGMSHFEFQILTSIVLTNLRLLRLWVTIAVLTHPRGNFTWKKLFKTKRAPSRW